MSEGAVTTPDAASNAAVSTPGTGKKSVAHKKAKGSSTSRSKPSHPPTSEMVDSAIKSLKERGGSSLQAIKKYVAANYKIDAEKLSPFIKKYLKSAVASGALVQTKGKGASGSFKLAGGTGKQQPSSSSYAEKLAKRPAAKSAKAAKKTKTSKKPAAEKKSSSSKAKKVSAPAVASAKRSSKPKTPSKAKKTTKVPTKKPKAPKPKKAKLASKPAAAAVRKTPKKK